MVHTDTSGAVRAGIEGDTDTATEVVPDLRLDDGDHERFSHYVKRSSIVSSAVEGHAVEALCGKKWVPSRNPERFPVCPDCERIYKGFSDPPSE